tara:strand:+ start:3705 stop:4010 length:306 start_codon:yes stop_codon:yes gene_type:complete
MAKEVKVKIYGQEYMLRTEAEPKVIEECANYLSDTMKQIAGPNSSSTPQLRLVIFAAMNITAQLFECKKKKEAVIDQVEAKTIAITEFIEDKISDIESSQN